MSRISVCFIDDEETETNRFQHFMEDIFDVGVGSSIETAEENLRANHPAIRKPDLYLLDMYYSVNNISSSAQKLKELEDAKKTFLKAQTDFKNKLSDLDQTPEGGYKLADSLVKRHRRNFAFFTRKGMAEDVEKALVEKKAIAVIMKPNPNETQLRDPDLQKVYDEAFQSNVRNLERLIREAASRATWARRHEALIGTIAGFLVGVVSAVTAGLLLKVF